MSSSLWVINVNNEIRSINKNRPQMAIQDTHTTPSVLVPIGQSANWQIIRWLILLSKRFVSVDTVVYIRYVTQNVESVSKKTIDNDNRFSLFLLLKWKILISTRFPWRHLRSSNCWSKTIMFYTKKKDSKSEFYLGIKPAWFIMRDTSKHSEIGWLSDK